MTTFAQQFCGVPPALEVISERESSAWLLLPPRRRFRGSWSSPLDDQMNPVVTVWTAEVFVDNVDRIPVVTGRKIEVDSDTSVVEFRELIRVERRKLLVRSWIAYLTPKSTLGRRALTAAIGCAIWSLIVVIADPIDGSDATATSDRTVVDSGGARPNQTTGVPGTEPLPPTGTVAPAPGPWIVPPGASWTG